MRRRKSKEIRFKVNPIVWAVFMAFVAVGWVVVKVLELAQWLVVHIQFLYNLIGLKIFEGILFVLKYLWARNWGKKLYLGLVICMLIGLGFRIYKLEQEKFEIRAYATEIEDRAISKEMEALEYKNKVEELVSGEKREYTQEEIEGYVRIIFGKDADVAIAVSRHECGPKNKAYPGCVLHTSAEYSVGLFQINMYSAVAKIHWTRIPGDSAEEKAQWLKNPFNNTLLAYWIYERSGWYPWSAYTNNSYKQSLGSK